MPLPPTLDESVARGIEFLAKQQNADGSIDGGAGPKLTMTGLSVMAFLAAGHTPDVGQHGLVVRDAIEFLLNQAPEDGYFGKVDASRMYGHAIVTLALAEAYGVETDEARRQRMHDVLTKAVGVILVAQSVQKPAGHAGGWRYEPTSPDSDLSVVAWNALALRAAQNVGADVPKEAVGRAVDYVLGCYQPQQKGFAYQPGGGTSTGTTGMAVLSLYLLGAGERAETVEGAKYLAANPLPADPAQFPYYAMYYAGQAAFQSGEIAWPAASKAVLERLIATQAADDGGWPASTDTREPGRVYSTSMALLTLTVPYRLLPIYQR